MIICWFPLVINQAFHSIPVLNEYFTSFIRNLHCSCLLHTMLLSLNNSKRKRYKLLLLNIFMFALLLDSNATLCVYDKDMPFFVYYLAMLLSVVCYRTCITCFSLCFLLTSGFVTTCMYNHFCFISKNLKNVIHLHVIVLSAMMFLFLFIFL